MPIKKVYIRVQNNNKKVVIIAPVKDSLHASLLADRIDKLPYMKVSERYFIAKTNFVRIRCFSIPSEFTYIKLQEDLETMSDLIILENESLPHPTARN